MFLCVLAACVAKQVAAGGVPPPFVRRVPAAAVGAALPVATLLPLRLARGLLQRWHSSCDPWPASLPKWTDRQAMAVTQHAWPTSPHEPQVVYIAGIYVCTNNGALTCVPRLGLQAGGSSMPAAWLDGLGGSTAPLVPRKAPRLLLGCSEAPLSCCGAWAVPRGAAAASSGGGSGAGACPGRRPALKLSCASCMTSKHRRSRAGSPAKGAGCR